MTEQYVRKIDKLKNAMNNSDWEKALAIAARFPRLGNHKARIIRAHEAITNPRFYAQLGKSPAKLINDGIDALKERYSV